MKRLSLALLVLAAACGDNNVVVLEDPAVTTVNPPPGPFNGSVTLTFTTDKAATLYVSTDGSDPREETAGRVSGPSPLTVELDKTAIVSFFSQTAGGAREAVRMVQYIRAGPPKGTISGTVVVGSLALNKNVAITWGRGSSFEIGKRSAPAEIPFTISGFGTGEHRLVAVADTSGDGMYGLGDYSSDPARIALDQRDPFRASAEGVRLYLGASPPELCSIVGTVYVPGTNGSENLSISALDFAGFTGGADPAALLAQLQNGYRLFTQAGTDAYPYAITDLNPGVYVPVPMLASFGGGGLALNLLANPIQAMSLGPGDVGRADFEYGPVRLSGTVTMTPAEPPQGFVYGVVAARHLSLFNGIQAVIMPAFFASTGEGQMRAQFRGTGLRDGVFFDVKVFTSLEGQNPAAAALGWMIQLDPRNPGPPPDARVFTDTNDVSVELNLTPPTP